MKRQYRGKSKGGYRKKPRRKPLATSSSCNFIPVLSPVPRPPFLPFSMTWLGHSEFSVPRNKHYSSHLQGFRAHSDPRKLGEQLLPSMASLQSCNGNSRELGAGGSTGGLSTSLVDRVTAATRTCSSLFLLQYPKLSKRKGSQLLGKSSKASQRSPTPKACL